MMEYPPSSIALSPQSPAGSTPTPTPTTNSTVFRPRRSDDWHEYREIIEQLYRNDQLKLRDVKRIMERDYKFQASEKQYKDRLAAWNVRKNIKAKEVHLMVRKQQKRAARGKRTAFRVNGQEIDEKRIARFKRRYNEEWDEKKDKDLQQMSPEPTTPSDMTCYTPEPTDEAPTPISPSDIQSPTREASTYPLSYDPNHIDAVPDLIMDEESPFSMTLNSPPPRRSYHAGPELAHIGHLGSSHPAHQPHPAHPPRAEHPTHSHHPSHQHLQHQHHPQLPQHSHPQHPPPMPAAVPASIPASMPAPVQTVAPTLPSTVTAPPVIDRTAPREYMTPSGMMVSSSGAIAPHSNQWDRLDTFQTRLEFLNHQLNASMSRWNRDQDPNELAHHPGHEGTGM
ncbi:hypothetical protein N7532_010098 [Penicillium argentinense]|uniref:Clr5 domain-containing protein n=1 Tax=Penicillium argentinense TaxID=1131581 RepID=A0A9W9EP07_9EURO|nr:uncharacterized protein N7532_010098 [Penicillium argentinense]KAJ5085327.1 hypothetical protein N7532_010098 [Penicillium argentinense]